jgi:hypothetical protein
MSTRKYVFALPRFNREKMFRRFIYS